MADHGAQRLGQPHGRAQRRQPGPGQQHGARVRAGGQRVHAAHKAAQHQRQRCVRLDQRQRQHQHGQRPPQPRFALHGEPPQKIQRGEQHAPAQQRRALRRQQVDDRVDPQNVLFGIVGRRRIVAGEDRGKILRAAKKIEKAEPAAHKKQPERKARARRAAQHRPRQLPRHAEHGHQRRDQRQQVGKPQPGPQQQENARDRLAQKRVAHRHIPGQHRLHRREQPAHGDALDVSQVQPQIAVAALPGVVSSVHFVQDVRVQKPERQRQHRQDAGGRGGRIPVKARPHPHKPRGKPQNERQRQRRRPARQRRPGRKAQRQRRQRGQRGQKADAERAPQRHGHRGRRAGQRAAGRQPPGNQKYGQIQKAPRGGCGGRVHHSPSPSNGGVYSSRALLFSCMYPSVRPSASAASTTLRYS